MRAVFIPGCVIPAVAATIAKGVELFDIAKIECGLLLHAVAQAGLEGAVARGIKRAERQSVGRSVTGRGRYGENARGAIGHRHDGGVQADAHRRDVVGFDGGMGAGLHRRLTMPVCRPGGPVWQAGHRHRGAVRGRSGAFEGVGAAPICPTARVEPASASEHGVADFNQPRIGRGIGRCLAQAARKLHFVLIGGQCERCNHCAGGRARNAHPAMDQQGRALIPVSGQRL
jgi:hypothetical protein